MQESQQQRARPCPHIEHAGILRGTIERCLDDRFAVAARDQRIGGHGEFEPEEFLYAHQMRHRLVGRASLNQPIETGRMRRSLVAHPQQQQLGT